MIFQFFCCSKSLEKIAAEMFSSTMWYMIIYECIKIFDKKIILFLFFTYQHLYLHNIYFVFLTKDTNANIILFFLIFWISLVFTGNSMSLKSSRFPKSLSAFVTIGRWWSLWFKYLTKHYFKHSLSSAFWILMKPFLVWSNSFGNLI